MSSLFLPFNNNPNSSTTKTGSYTIPANTYAFVTAEVQDGGTFSIDAVLALSSTGSTVTGVSVGSSVAATISYTVPADLVFTGQISSDAFTDVFTIGGNTITPSTTAAYAVPVTAGPGQVISCVSGGASNKSITGHVTRPNGNTVATASFWVKTGTAFTVSGNARYTVSEYLIS